MRAVACQLVRDVIPFIPTYSQAFRAGPVHRSNPGTLWFRMKGGSSKSKIRQVSIDSFRCRLYRILRCRAKSDGSSTGKRHGSRHQKPLSHSARLGASAHVRYGDEATSASDVQRDSSNNYHSGGGKADRARSRDYVIRRWLRPWLRVGTTEAEQLVWDYCIIVQLETRPEIP